MKKIFFLLLSFSAFSQNDQIVRGPYLQSMTSESVLIQWRTASPQSSQVTLVTKGEKKTRVIADTNRVIDHIVKVSGLRPSKSYTYSISPKHQGSFHTKPKAGDPKSVRIWALGDFGYVSPNQKAVISAIKNYTADKPIDAWIWLGDNAYNNGKEEEYQQHVFDVYQADFFLIWPYIHLLAITITRGSTMPPFHPISKYFPCPPRARLVAWPLIQNLIIQWITAPCT